MKYPSASSLGLSKIYETARNYNRTTLESLEQIFTKNF